MERRLDAIVDVMRVPATGDPAPPWCAVGRPRARSRDRVRGPRRRRRHGRRRGRARGGRGAAGASASSRRPTGSAASSRRRASRRSTSTSTSRRSAAPRATTACATRIRDHYRGARRRRRQASPSSIPATCWVTRARLRAEGRRSRRSTAMLRPHRRRAGSHPAAHQGGRRRGRGRPDDDRLARHRPRHRRAPSASAPAIVIDATELGDLLPLAGAEYVVGAETIAETGEPHAQPHEPKPHCVQSFTYTFAARAPPRRRAARHRDAGQVRALPRRPALQPHASKCTAARSTARRAAGSTTGCTTRMPGTKGGLWTYRRLIDAAQLRRRYAHDITMFNWPGNDYRERQHPRPARAPTSPRRCRTPSASASASCTGCRPRRRPRAIAAARPSCCCGPTSWARRDGLSKHPYIRESRRIRALTTIVEQDVSSAVPAGPAARHLRRFGRHRLVSDRHPPRRSGGRRRQLPHQAVSDSARRADSASACAT